VSEHLDHVIRAYKWKRWAIKMSHTHNSIPTTCKSNDPRGPNRDRHEPHAKEIYLHFPTKRLFETSRQLLGFCHPGSCTPCTQTGSARHYPWIVGPPIYQHGTWHKESRSDQCLTMKASPCAASLRGPAPCMRHVRILLAKSVRSCRETDS